MTGIGTFFFVETDLLPDFSVLFEVEDEDGLVTGPLDLTGFISIDLRMRRDDGQLIVRPITIDDGPNGLGHFEWAAGDLVQGEHKAEIRMVRTSDSKPETIPDEQPMIFSIRRPV